MWRSGVVNSNGFDDPRLHHNPSSMPLESMEWTADRTNVGRYELSREATNEIGNFQSLRLTSETPYKGRVQVYGNMLYDGNPQRPQVSVLWWYATLCVLSLQLV